MSTSGRGTRGVANDTSDGTSLAVFIKRLFAARGITRLKVRGTDGAVAAPPGEWGVADYARQQRFSIVATLDRMGWLTEGTFVWQPLVTTSCIALSIWTTTDAGIPIESDEHSLTIGQDGPILLHDHYLIEQMASFNGARTPAARQGFGCVRPVRGHSRRQHIHQGPPKSALASC